MLSPRDQVIEAFGRYFEQYTLPRILGRVYGLLLITNDPHLGLEEMAEQLGVSKASVSTTVRQLSSWTLIDRVSLPGDRRDYYRVSPEAHVQYLKLSLEKVLSFSGLLARAAHLEGLSTETRQKLERLEHVYEAIGTTIVEFFDTYTNPAPGAAKTRAARPAARSARANGKATR